MTTTTTMNRLFLLLLSMSAFSVLAATPNVRVGLADLSATALLDSTVTLVPMQTAAPTAALFLTLRTDTSGVVTFTNVPAGRYMMHMANSGIPDLRIIIPDQTAEVRAELVLESAWTLPTVGVGTLPFRGVPYLWPATNGLAGQTLANGGDGRLYWAFNAVVNDAGVVTAPTNWFQANRPGLINLNSIFSDSWSPVSEDTNTVGWWRSYAGVTVDSTTNVHWLADGSGAGHPFTNATATTRPMQLTNGVREGLASIKFDLSNDYMATESFNLLQPISMYLALKVTNWAAFGRILSGRTNGFIGQVTAAPTMTMRTFSSAAPQLSAFTTNYGWGNLLMVWTNTASQIQLDGLYPTTGTTSDGGFDGLFLSSSATPSLYGGIEFMELWIRAGIDTADYRLKANRYLCRMQGRPFRLILFDGNSLSLTTLGVNSIQALVVTNYFAQGQTWHVKTVAASGDATPELTARSITTDRYFHAGNTTNILVVWEGFLDLSDGSSTNTAFSNLKTYGQARKAAGWKVVAMTLPNRADAGLAATYEDDRLNLNRMIRANYLQFSDTLADVGTNSFLGCTLCAATNTYFSDGLHLTAAANALVATAITNAIAQMVP